MSAIKVVLFGQIVHDSWRWREQLAGGFLRQLAALSPISFYHLSSML